MKIKKITDIDVVPSRRIYVGDYINGRKIAFIEDKSIELENGAIESLYLCKDKEDNVLVSIEKCSVVVQYEYIEAEETVKEHVEEMVEEMKEKFGMYHDEMHQYYNSEK